MGYGQTSPAQQEVAGAIDEYCIVQNFGGLP